MEWWVILLLIVGIWLVSSALFSAKESKETQQEKSNSDNDKNQWASEYVDDLLDTGQTERRPNREELSDESWRRKQNQGSIEDRRGPGRF